MVVRGLGLGEGVCFELPSWAKGDRTWLFYQLYLRWVVREIGRHGACKLSAPKPQKWRLFPPLEYKDLVGFAHHPTPRDKNCTKQWVAQNGYLLKACCGVDRSHHQWLAAPLTLLCSILLYAFLSVAPNSLSGLSSPTSTSSAWILLSQWCVFP